MIFLYFWIENSLVNGMAWIRFMRHLRFIPSKNSWSSAAPSSSSSISACLAIVGRWHSLGPVSGLLMWLKGPRAIPRAAHIWTLGPWCCLISNSTWHRQFVNSITMQSEAQRLKDNCNHHFKNSSLEWRIHISVTLSVPRGLFGHPPWKLVFLPPDFSTLSKST